LQGKPPGAGKNRPLDYDTWPLPLAAAGTLNSSSLWQLVNTRTSFYRFSFFFPGHLLSEMKPLFQKMGFYYIRHEKEKTRYTGKSKIFFFRKIPDE
jgi:hypothetical protein